MIEDFCEKMVDVCATCNTASSRIIVTNNKNNLEDKFAPRFLRRDGGRLCEIGTTMQMQRGAWQVH